VGRGIFPPIFPLKFHYILNKQDNTVTDLTNANSSDSPETDELTMLKTRATMMGITFSNNIKLDTLKARISEKLAEDDVKEVAIETKNEIQAMREEIFASQLKLVRVRVANLDPKKKDLPGEIFTVANEYIGTVRKFVPYGEATDDGYHIPFCIYTMLEEKRFLHIRSTADRRTGAIRTETSWQKEFAIEILPQLTPAELADLAKAQLAAGSVVGSATDFMA
jgi:hypothetical protein